MLSFWLYISRCMTGNQQHSLSALNYWGFWAHKSTKLRHWSLYDIGRISASAQNTESWFMKCIGQTLFPNVWRIDLLWNEPRAKKNMLELIGTSRNVQAEINGKRTDSKVAKNSSLKRLSNLHHHNQFQLSWRRLEQKTEFKTDLILRIRIDQGQCKYDKSLRNT